VIPIEEFRQIFRRRFGREPEVVARAPGRVNLIGEHTDYNDGFVLPVAIDREIWVGVAGREDRLLSGFSIEHESFAQVSLDSFARGGKSSWMDYPAGVAHQLLSRGLPLPGTDLLIAGDVPVGAGLSSSAALLVASATAWNHLCKWNLSQREIIEICKQAENEYVGVACGIMDQYVSCAGRKGHALFIDCRDLASRAVPLPRALSILVCDTGVRRDLATSEYNRRRAECEEGVRLLRKHVGDISALRDVTPDQFEKYEDRLPRLTARRCRHVVSENARVLEALDALIAGDAEKFGGLMNESHESLACWERG
jgi:galactokinase